METLVSEIEKLRERGKEILYCSVRHRGKTLLDQWFEPLDPATPLPVYSVSKTVTALLVGTALEQGHFRGLEAPVRELVPEYTALIPEGLTLKHLLTMTAGYHWPEVATFGSQDGVFRQFLDAGEPIRFILEQPRTSEPGARYEYSSGISHLLMILLERAVGMSAADYGREALWQPLGVPEGQWAWKADRNGVPYGGHGLSLTADGMNRLGQLLLGLGRYEGRQVIVADYMAALSSVQVSGVRGYAGYGFQTWIGEVEGSRFYAAFGHGGQRIYLFPERELQVVFLGRKVLPEFGAHERLIRIGILPRI